MKERGKRDRASPAHVLWFMVPNDLPRNCVDL
jgi:hypothetical protein